MLKVFKLSDFIFVCSFFYFIFFGCISKSSDYVMDKRELSLRKSALLVQKEISDVENLRVQAFEEFFEAMTIEEKVCQMFITNLEGNRIFVPVEYEKNNPLIPGGFLFFSYNFADNAHDVICFTNSIKNFCAANSIIPPFLAVDQEGGLVERLKKLNAPLPSAEEVSKNLSLGLAYKLYSLQAMQMKALGFDMNLAPVLEVCTSENSLFLDGRSFGSELMSERYGIACVNGYENFGIGAIAKHFPGNSNIDPHFGLPVITWDMAYAMQVLVPFKRVVSNQCTGILMSHAAANVFDSKVPACFSNIWIEHILRERFEFDGIVFSDDIYMAALAENGFPPDEAAVKAVEAGINCIMISEKKFKKPAEGLIEKAKTDDEFLGKINVSVRRLLEYKIKCGLLKYEKYEEKLILIPYFEPLEISERLRTFEIRRKENMDLYREYF